MVGRIMLGAGILAVLLFGSMGSWLLFCLSAGIAAIAGVTSWLSVWYARHGFAKRVADLRESLLYSRTLEKRLHNDHSVDLIERDDVEVLIAKVLRGRTEPGDLPGWAICDIHQIDEVKGLCQGNLRAIDPDAQPAWLCVVGTLFLAGCPVLLVIACLMKMVGLHGV